MTTKEIRKRYTRVVKVGGEWVAFLQIDHQGFAVCELTSRRRARWYADMLAIALERMIESALDGSAKEE